MKSRIFQTGLARGIATSTIYVAFAPTASASSIEFSSTIGSASTMTRRFIKQAALTLALMPIPGTKWESMVRLYANRAHKQDAWATAIGA